jgi:hypothetical protein
MNDWGLKVSTPGNQVETTSLNNLVIDTNFPFAKCDLRSKPYGKNYGLINLLISSVTVGHKIIVYLQPHGYSYAPDFLTAWNYPIGDGLGSTYGIGDIDATLTSGLYIAMYCDSSNFYLQASNGGVSTVSGVNATIRFYIFADDFSDV